MGGGLLIIGVVVAILAVGGFLYLNNSHTPIGTFSSQGAPLVMTYNFGGGNPVASSATNTNPYIIQNPYINQGLFPGSTTELSNYSNYGFGIEIVPNPDTEATIRNLSVTLDGTTLQGSTTENYTTGTLYWEIGTLFANCQNGFNVQSCYGAGQHQIVVKSGQYVTALNFRIAG